ncbi:hypothetical protein GcM1_06936 [Golovinomyces cichoracearum]|uniref:Uncharacterized protein n=1 Tax=Golovinomyces cichoracearum TaxID=62708 RepID=A0A420JC68_9PEZI|nr:hypothetical protein GcM1_06936 [Golovinomyces cichoracearum]
MTLAGSCLYAFHWAHLSPFLAAGDDCSLIRPERSQCSSSNPPIFRRTISLSVRFSKSQEDEEQVKIKPSVARDSSCCSVYRPSPEVLHSY